MRGYRTARPTIALTNRRRGGTAVTVLRGLLVFLLWLPLPISIIATVALSTYMERVPPTPNLELMRHTPASTIVTTDRTRVGGLIRGREPYADHTDIPARVKFAFLAAEDDAFFEHSGFDMIAIARAFLRNQAAGRIVEGGSTLTQQLAKTIVSNEESYHRKIIEVFLARRIEARYTKSDILEVYLNHIYLGAGAYGVVAAAKIYFDKTLPELTWDEAALIAGITQSPTALNPFRHPERTLDRRRLILNRLVLLGVMSPDEANAAIARPLSLRTDWNGDEDTAPYAAVEARERLKQWYGHEVMESGGYRATLSLSPALQGHARYAVARGLRALDRRQGYRGPLAHIAHGHWDTFEHRVATIYGTQEDNWSPVPMRPYVGLVREVSPEQMRVSIGGLPVTVALHSARWAFPYDRSSKRNTAAELADLGHAFAPGDVIVVAYDTWTIRPPGDTLPKRRRKRRRKRRQEEEEPLPTATGWRLDQLPRVEGMLLSTDINTGYVRAVVGGWDFDRSQFNRAIHGCRQPGSVFKPIVYSRALEHGLTPATVLADAPLKILKEGGEVWAPKNADWKFSGYLLLRDALARSRNLPSVEVFNHVGAEDAARQAYRLGITTEMAVTEALSLGASCVKPWDLMRVYGTFARQGVKMEPHMLLTVEDHRGQVLWDRGHFADASSPTMARLDRMVRGVLDAPPRVLHEAHAYQMLHLLRAVVHSGTAGRASALGVPVAGKTGTTNAYDTWFVGFTEDILTSVWVGADDNDRPVGSRETGGRVALPIWLRYMQTAIDGRPQGALIGPPPDSIEMHRIDRDLGMASKEGEPGVRLPFVRGTQPTEEAPDRNQKAALRVDDHAINF